MRQGCGRWARSIELLDERNAAVNAQRSAVEGDVVVLRVAPFHIRIEPVIGRAPLVLVAYPLLGGFLPLAVDLDDAFRAEGTSAWMKTLRQSALSRRM